jgi:hypothetical protein
VDGSGVQRQETNKNKMIQRMISVNERKNEMGAAAGKKMMNFADIAILMLAHKNQMKKIKKMRERAMRILKISRKKKKKKK